MNVLESGKRLKSHWIGCAAVVILCVADPALSDRGQSREESKGSQHQSSEERGNPGERDRDTHREDRHGANRYVRRALVSDQAGLAEQLDPDLRNAWGIAFNPTGFVGLRTAVRENRRFTMARDGRIPTLWSRSALPLAKSARR